MKTLSAHVVAVAADAVAVTALFARAGVEPMGKLATASISAPDKNTLAVPDSVVEPKWHSAPTPTTKA